MPTMYSSIHSTHKTDTDTYTYTTQPVLKKHVLTAVRTHIFNGYRRCPAEQKKRISEMAPQGFEPWSSVGKTDILTA